MIYKGMKSRVLDDFNPLTFAVAVPPFNSINTLLSVRKESKLSSESKSESGLVYRLLVYFYRQQPFHSGVSPRHLPK